MYYNKYFIIFIILIMPILANGQLRNYTLNGHIHTQYGDTYPYQLTFSISGETIVGYSITRFSDGSKQKIIIKGHVDRDKQVITISEKKPVSNAPNDFSMCLIDATLNYKLQNAKYTFSGPFTGKNHIHRLCGTGTMEFEPLAVSNDVFKKETIKPLKTQPGKPLKDSAMIAKHPGLDYEITSGVQKEFKWATDSCVIALWDAGIIDGDMITILFNNKEMLHNYTLTPDKIQLTFPITQPINTITVIADDEGTIPPNTTEILLYDGSKKYYITAYNKKGGRAVIILNRK
jgi:hypothetical protein